MNEPSRADERPKPTFRFDTQTLLIATFAFALGMVARNVASGVHIFTLQFGLPSSTSPIIPGDSLIVECEDRPSLDRRVRVLADGKITLKGIGTLDISGQTIGEIEKTIQDNYRQLYRDASYRSIEVFRADSSVPLK